ncbi:MAG: ABC transporter ATP-binding protein/permease [Eubacteriales bacterium]|nr:ABC transporter ATP-binding protein/permease [Eubacteriales bacterium]
MAKNEYKLGEAKIRQGGGRMRVNEKPRDFKGTIKQLLSYLRVFLPQYAIAFTCAIVGVLLQLFGPDNMRKITNLIEDGMSSGRMDLSGIIRISVLVICFYLGSSLISLVQSLVLTNATQNTMRYMRNEISKKLNRIPLRRFDSSSFGDLLSRVTNDVDTIGMSLNHAASEIVSSLTTFLGCLIMMLLTNVTLSGIAIVCSLSGFFMMKIVISRSQKFFTRRQTYLGLINGHIEEMYAGHVIVKAYNGEAQSIEEFEILNRHLYENNWKSQFISGIMRPIMEFLSNAGYVAICVLGAIMVRNGVIRFGTVIAFILYVKMFTQPLGQIAQAATSIQSATAAAERIFSFLGEEEMENESAKPDLLSNVDGLVNFDHVHFGYLPDKPVIHDFSAEIKPGQKVAIVGPTGAGKTTMVNLLMRFYDIDSGTITIDGINTRDVPRENVHDQFCMVLQDTWLFEGSIKDNIVYSMKGVTDEQVVEACKAVGLHHFISSLPDGYDTVLTDDSNLSAGQRQLITIARAMIRNAPLLILDEATSSVDTRTEQIVQDAMDALTKGRTSFTIAHRLSTIRNADVILVMKDGDIVESGTHEGLLEAGGFYAQLWTSQFVNAEEL